MGLLLGFALIPAPAALFGQEAPQAAPATLEVTVESDVMVPMRDGVKLAADVYRPSRDGKPLPGGFPTLLQRTPYSKGDGKNSEANYFAERGYVVVLQDVRGRYKSEGSWRMMLDDPQDGFDTVEWIAQQRWSNGKIGTFGTSYPGGTQHALAEMNPPHLTTMIPVDALSNCGVSGLRQGGAFELRFVNWIFNQGASNSKPALANPALKSALDENARRIRDHVLQLPIRPGTSPLRVVPEYEAWVVEALRSGPEAAFWHAKGMSVVDHVGDYADVPVMHVTGWYDSWTRQVTMNYQALSRAKKGPHHLMIGPWVHGGQGSNVAGEVEFSRDAALDFNALRLRWYDHWMKGDKNAVESAPPVLIYVMGTGDDRRTSEGRLMHGGSWRAEREWPLARARPTKLHLHPDGALRADPPTRGAGSTTFTFDPRHPVPTIGGNISSNTNLMSNGGYDQRPRDDTPYAENQLPLSQRQDVLVFRTEPLAENMEVTGTVQVNLWVASSALDTDFTAKLIDEIPPNPDYPLGYDLNIGDSIMRLRYREGLDRQVPYTPDSVVPLTITLYPTSNVFKKGHRIRVDISSSNFPRFDLNPNTGEPLGTGRRFERADNSVGHSTTHPSHIVLPVIPAGP